MKKLIIFTLILAILASMMLVSCNKQTESGSNSGDANSGDANSDDKNDSTESLEFPEAPSEGLKFSQIDDQTCRITGIGICTDTMIRIPSEIGGLKVTEVYGGNDWRKNYGEDPIKGIMFPEGVTKISSYEGYCFSPVLEKIVLPDTPIMIYEEVFTGTPYWVNSDNWTDGALYIGKHLISVKYEVGGTVIVRNDTLDIASHAFYESAANHVVIPESVAIINDEAFMHCEELTRLTIGKGVKYIGESALYNCDPLSKIAYTGTETEWKSINKSGMRGGTTPIDYDVIYNWSETETGTPSAPGTTDAKYFTFELNEDNASYKVKVNKDYIGAVTEYHIPAEYEGLPVTAVGSFGGLENVTAITMPDSVTSVDAFAFGTNHDLTYIKLSSNLKLLPENLCSGCEKLTSVVIPASVEQINTNAFGSCVALSSIKFEGTVAQWNSVVRGEWWYSGTFDNDLVKNVTCSDGVGALFSKKVTEAEWNAMVEYNNFKNVTIDVYAEFLEGWGSEDPTYRGTIKNAGDVIKVYGEFINNSDEVLAYRGLYINFIIELVKDFEKFEYDDASALYVSKESISYTASISYPEYNYSEEARITANNVKVELDDSKRIAKVTSNMRQEIDLGDDFPTILVLNAVLTLSDYGTTTMQ